MPANLLILPLVAGYLFIHISLRLRFRAQSLDGYRLLLEAAIAGVFLLAAARMVVVAARTVFPNLPIFWHSFVPNIPYLGTATASVILGVVLPFLDNRRPRYRIFRRIARSILLIRSLRPVRRIAISLRDTFAENRQNALQAELVHANALLRLLNAAMKRRVPISVTLVSRKWFVGYVAEMVNLEPREEYFRLLPILSGYRDKDTLRMVRTVYYREAYQKAEDLSVFIVTLALKDVQDARVFDEELYEEHFARTPAAGVGPIDSGEPIVP